MKRILLIALFVLSVGAAAQAAGVRYYEDPVYVKINQDDEHPMDDLMLLAKRGDARAQFILGDLYSKGKGGLARNRVKARYWFEVSARHGYTASFIRLAALAKRSRDYIGAYQWYTLNAEHAGKREATWSKSELQRLGRSLSKGAVREARDGAKAWLAGQSVAMRSILQDERIARETLPAPDLGEHDNETKKDEKTAVKETPETPETSRKEHHYNE
jgi:TPR repeat protein